jgi:formate C-acetyltransferase
LRVGIEVNNRISRLRKNLEFSVHEQVKDRGSIFIDPRIEGAPLPIRKAKALSLFLNKAPVNIYPGELIVGSPFPEKGIISGKGAKRSLPPESVSGQGYIDGAKRKIGLGFGDEPYDPVIQILEDYGSTTKYGVFPSYANELELDRARGIGLGENSNPGHLQAGYPRLMEYGFSGIKEMAERKLGMLKKHESHEEKAIFLQSVIISMEAAQEFSLRYAKHTEEMANKEADMERRWELEEISRVCEAIASRAPMSFREALQLIWFNHLIANTQGARQLGRFDQYLYPFLERDMEEGGITLEEARELLQCLWIKFSSITDITMDNLQNIILGGKTPEGGDATNLLSYMCLDVTDELELIDPKVSVRLHRETPGDFLQRLCDIIKKGKFQPGIYNDEIIIPALVETGIPIEDARDYTNDGCSEILVQGRTNPWAFEAKVNLLKCLEMVLDKLQDYDTFQDLMEALKDRIGYAVEMATYNCNILQEGVPKISPNPFISSSVEGCLEKALDITEGGAKFNSSAVCATGVADTADSLSALRKLVFEEGKITKSTLIQALKENYQGYERLRHMLLNRAPKFGNDIEYVDELAVEIVEYTSNEVGKYTNPRGGRYILGLFSYGEYIGHGIVTGATPDGRKAGEGVAPNFSPAPGRDEKGAFAVLKSTTRVNQMLTPNGTALDLTIHPTALSGPKGVEKMMGFLRSMLELGAMQVQFNIVDADILKAAKKEPEKYRNLTVRLWGFPAYFVRLPKEFQDHIIMRSEHRI